jgi:hypothetical protein
MELASGFGAAWIGGVEHGDVLRMDPATRRVVARIPVGKVPSGNADGTLTRIDASNGRVRWTARPAAGAAQSIGSRRRERTTAIAGDARSTVEGE